MSSSTNLPLSQTPQTLFASIDIGTNSFKLLIIRAYPTGKFHTITRLKQPVVLGRDFFTSSSSSASPPRISTHSQSRSLDSLLYFKTVIDSHCIDRDHTRAVATQAVREAENQREFIECVKEKAGFEVDVLSGEDEARFAYLGVLQFLPVFEKWVLCVDIGGGSTEFVIGKEGKIVFCESLKLGHVSLSEKFVTSGGEFDILKMRECVRMVVEESGLVEKVKRCGFEVAVGSSGTIRAIEKAVFKGYCQYFWDNVGVLGDCKRDWRLSREDLKGVVERLLCRGAEGESVRRDRFFKSRSEFIVAGAVLLEEIFGLLGIEEMEVSGYGLGEGVIAERLGKVFDGYDLTANARWRSVVRLAMRFNGKKRIKSAAQCASIAKDIFEGLRKCDGFDSDQAKLIASLDEKDLEYLEAACLLHNIGLFIRKKGYQKQSYRIIMDGDQLYGYSVEEIKLIALLAKYHRKKLPKFGHASLKDFSEEKFRILCTIMRLSVNLQQNEWLNVQEIEFLHSIEGFKLVIGEEKDRPFLPGTPQPTAEDIGVELRQELEYFKSVFKQELLIVLVPSEYKLGPMTASNLIFTIKELQSTYRITYMSLVVTKLCPQYVVNERRAREQMHPQKQKILVTLVPCKTGTEIQLIADSEAFIAKKDRLQNNLHIDYTVVTVPSPSHPNFSRARLDVPILLLLYYSLCFVSIKWKFLRTDIKTEVKSKNSLKCSLQVQCQPCK